VNAPDRKGLTAFVTDMVYKAGGNIIDLQQHVDSKEKEFFLRLVWDLNGFQIPRQNTHAWLQNTLPEEFRLNWHLHYSDERLRLALFATKEAHCLHDIIARVQSGEWEVDIPMIISNHTVLEPIATACGIAFEHVPVDKQNKAQQEQTMLQLLARHNVDLIVLARYMQILSPAFTDAYRNRIINIHHSFLPAFPGSKPYHSAYQRGVKIIGATSHYVTPELDAGPIIAQDVIAVSHLDTVEDFIRKGRDIEKMVLARAINAHAQQKILVSGNRTVVFY
jgi:formyltetrahydrofolate deformylase